MIFCTIKMNNKASNVGILGAGHIAEKMTKTIASMPDMTIAAVASHPSPLAFFQFRGLLPGFCRTITCPGLPGQGSA